ncbi:unnamed protein product [Callosobruchus maculatus]|uniref:Uncharacterized protein n=1 Tax=Callosobruchus maculatus TaxID=64391 RepID=A0A653CRF6_CALMS|nr:unnamed protein product [Callosobruchus maculatus]
MAKAEQDCDDYYLDEMEAEVEDTLQQIDSKYCVVTAKCGDSFHQSLVALSQEFDSLGLPPLDLSQSSENLFKEVVDGAHYLVNLCRSTVVQTKNATTENRMIAARQSEVQHINNDLKNRIQKQEERRNLLENHIRRLKTEQLEAKQREEVLKQELQKTKRYYQSKEKGYVHDIKRLVKEKQKLEEKCGLDINIHSKDDCIKNLLVRYKQNEQVLKDTVTKMIDENRKLLEENLHLRGQT